VFFDHVKKIIPDPYYRQMVLSYLASCIQFQDRKFYWKIKLRGIEGNGKSIITDIVDVKFFNNDLKSTIIYTAQQKPEDLEKDGLDALYFQNLIEWLQNGGKIQVLNFLKIYYIPKLFNPAIKE
jgi:hypothetical protein